MFLHSTAMAIASSVTAGAIAVTSLVMPHQAAAPEAAKPQVTAEDIVIHAAMPNRADHPTPSVYDVLGHLQLSEAETYCDVHQVLTQGLTDDFAETLQAEKTSSEGLKIELWTSDVMGTWTALHHGSDGISCVIASGVDWSAAIDANDLIRIAMHEVAFNL